MWIVNYSEIGTTIEIGLNCITKTYNVNGPLCILHLQTIYALLHQKKVPNVNSLLNTYIGHPQHGTIAILQPKGVNHPPSSCQEVQQAVLCILETLMVCLGILCLNSTNVCT
jgi:hypothetical protein